MAAADKPRRAGVSSFGASGTNAHVIIEETPDVAAGRVESAVDGPVPLVLSASSEQALRAQAARLRAHLNAGANLADTAYSLATTRATLAHRAVVVGADRDDALAGLAALAAGKPVRERRHRRPGRRPRRVFVFPGQGSQWPGMAVDLLDASPVFRERVPGLRARPRAARRLLAGRRVARRRRPVRSRGRRAAAAVRGDGVARGAVAVARDRTGRRRRAQPGRAGGRGGLRGVVVPDAAAVVALRSQAIAEELSGRAAWSPSRWPPTRSANGSPGGTARSISPPSTGPRRWWSRVPRPRSTTSCA